MIIAQTHHRHHGSHTADALLDWLDERSWTPLSRRTLQDETERATKDEMSGGVLPYPSHHWVRGPDRIAASTVSGYYWRGPEQLRRDGWQQVALYDLGDVIERFRETIGFRCRACRQVFPAAGLAEMPSPYHPERDALCTLCRHQAERTLRGERKAAETLLRMPSMLIDARAALRRIQALDRRRIPASARRDLDIIAQVLGVKPQAETNRSGAPQSVTAGDAPPAV